MCLKPRGKFDIPQNVAFPGADALAGSQDLLHKLRVGEFALLQVK